MFENNPIIRALGGLNNFKQRYDAFASNLPNNGIDAKQQALMQAQQMLNSGQMTQDQYNQILQLAQMLSGWRGR